LFVVTLYNGEQNYKFKAVYTRKLGKIYFRRGEHGKALESFKKAFRLNSFVIQIPENISFDPINQTG
jgi:tetratricopeptide (TPR) repeat protein